MKKVEWDRYAEGVQIKKMHDQGISAYAIAKSIGRSKSYVLNRIPELSFVSCPNIDKVLSLGKSGHSIKVIAQRSNTDAATVVYHLRMNSVPTDDMSILAPWLYEIGNSISIVRAATGLSYEKISELLQEKKIPTRIKTAAEISNEDFFRVIDTPEKAYWLGFLYADGNVSSDGRYVQIKLHSRDHEHLVKFANAIGYAGSIHRYNTVTNYGAYEFSQIVVTSKVLNADLVKSGCVPNKTKWAEPPSLKKNLVHHFIRGLIDGDGTLVKCSGVVKGIRFYGVVKMVDWAASQIPGGRVRQHSGQTWQVNWSGVECIRSIYEGSTDETRLDRKYDEVKESLNEVVISI